MKRWILAAMMLIFFFLAVGCEKDEVVAPEVNDDVKQSEELAGADDEVNVEGDGKSVEEQAGSKIKVDLNEERAVAQKETKEIVQPEESKVATPSQTKPSGANAQAEPPKQPANEVKQQEPPAQPKPAPEPAQAAPEPTKPVQTVTITITAPEVKGTIVPVTTVEMQDGDTVLSVTQRIVKARGIQIDVTGSGATAYIQGIDNIYEFDHGPLSGWEVFVDGKAIDTSAGVYGVQPGQAIMWRYTKDYTK
ncbi:cytoskeletal protein RodZ [Neobacillus niacini]|jgi:hypothetical protein|uniref:DUF4430 domain-containing protein n=1 Tax=Neobacillus driksii TaxID=3035913 RepID=UPI002787272B|nr:DUF4430 domain-containing protein [Neobacillus niacini]MDQ0972364.1 cytoskeletal protein RodZ [Neobacillus niacini]